MQWIKKNQCPIRWSLHVDYCVASNYTGVSLAAESWGILPIHNQNNPKLLKNDLSTKL
jgi:hypothetical protein